MFESTKSGWKIIKSSHRILLKFPQLYIPLFLIWIIMAPIVLYLNFQHSFDGYSFGQALLFIYGVLFTYSFLFSLSNLITLEMIERIETGRRPSFFSSFYEVLTKNLIKALPVIVAWSAIWFVLTVIEAILSSKDKDNDRPEYNARNAAKALAGNEETSLLGITFDALTKGVRMLAFLILPAVAWENQGGIKAIQKGIAVAKIHWAELANGFVMTKLAAGIIFLPVGIIFQITEDDLIILSDEIWYCVWLYVVMTWSYYMYLEQMFTAQLYMWDIKWKKACDETPENSPRPKLSDIPKPSLLDDTLDLSDIES